MEENKMNRINSKLVKISFLVLFLLFLLVASSVFSAENKKDLYSLEDISNILQFHLSGKSVLRILEVEKLYDSAVELTDRMLELSIRQYNEASNEEVKEAAKLNIGFFAVAKKQFDPEYRVDYGLNELVEQECENIKNHKGLKFRELLTYIENPNIYQTHYAYEDYSQYIPRGHYTRNEKLESYFKAMMWYGRIDFKLRPASKEPAITYGKKMTLQAILMADALLRDEDAFKLWKMIYEPTVYFAGKTDDLYVDDYIKLIKKIFPLNESVDKYNNQEKLAEFIDKAIQLRAPKILSGLAFAEDGDFRVSTQGFRFMGQRFIPDSYMFQELVFGVKDEKVTMQYTGDKKPFTMEIIPNFGPVRAFPRGLDICAVLGSKRALEILEVEGDTEYAEYYNQLDNLKEEFSLKTVEEWKQNLYWRWLYALLPLLEKNKDTNLPSFMQSPAWIDKELQTVLGSWTELRHDTILYAKQSYTMAGKGMPPEPKSTYGYVAPYPEVYARLEEMMKDLRNNLTALDLAIEGIPEKIKEFEELLDKLKIEFEELLDKLKIISEKEINNMPLYDEEYEFIWNVGRKLASLKEFPLQILGKITSNTDEKIEIVADVHTDVNSGQVLEEGVGSPFNIYVIIDDAQGIRICRGAVFSYYEFKHPMEDRLTDEKWQEMGEKRERANQPDWVKTFVGE
jgi:archaellum component FlaC